MCQNTVTLEVLKWSATAYRKRSQYVSKYKDPGSFEVVSNCLQERVTLFVKIQ